MIDAATIAENVTRALEEDIGSGDRSAKLISPDISARAELIAREDCILAGRPWAEAAFKRVSPAIRMDWQVDDGEAVPANGRIATFEGPARALLTAERTAINFLQTLSATATVTRRYVDEVEGTGVRILDTRKTLPGLRKAQKYAVATGGGHNHRMGLFDAILVKENHILATGSLEQAVQAARRQPHDIPLQVEVESIAELEAALALGVDRILLDNFDLDQLRTAVQTCAGRAMLEASGNITLENVRAVAQTGVDAISIGALTKHVQAIDLSLRFALQPREVQN
ncbi:MAG: carboxylating nicotinate-nucleotide diphosphorylase [Halothiobacillaceae bacterium]